MFDVASSEFGVLNFIFIKKVDLMMKIEIFQKLTDCEFYIGFLFSIG